MPKNQKQLPLKRRLLEEQTIAPLVSDAVAAFEVYEANYHLRADELDPVQTAQRLKREIGAATDSVTRDALKSKLAACEGSGAELAKSAARREVHAAYAPVKVACLKLVEEAIKIVAGYAKEAKEDEQALFGMWGLPHSATAVSGNVREFSQKLYELKWAEEAPATMLKSWRYNRIIEFFKPDAA